MLSSASPGPDRQARASGAGRGRGGGGRRGEAPARAPLAARARTARSRRPRRHLFFFPPSVRLSAVGFVCPPRRPSPPRRQPGPQPPSAHRGRVPESPGPAGWSCGRGPLSRGLSVRRRSPGTRSAEAAASHHSDSGDFTLLRGNLIRAGGLKRTVFGMQL